MRAAMAVQPSVLREILADDASAQRAAERLHGRALYLCGTGSSWHAANHGAFLLRAAGVGAWPVQAADAAHHGPRPAAGDGLILLSHTGAKRVAAQVLERARAEGVECVTIGASDRDGMDLPTVPRETSSAYTVSHLAALLRLAQVAEALGAEVGDLHTVPEAVQAVLDGPPPEVRAPRRLLEFTGAGTNQWTAAEGALKARETARVATEGLAVEQLLHGPAVTLDERDVLVCLDGGGPERERLEAVAALAEGDGAAVHRIRDDALGEPLSIFALTVAVQRIALGLADALGTDADAFGYDVPGRRERWEAVQL